MKMLKCTVFTLIMILSLTMVSNIQAQCPMCKANVESSMKSGGRKTGMGLNSGIIALLVMPYIMVSVVGVVWYTNSRKKRALKGQGNN